MDEAEHRLTDIFSALSNPIRYRILQLLREKPRTVTTLQDILERPQNLVSNHLRVLRDHELVQSRSEGSHRIYSLKRPGLVQACLDLRSFVERDPDAD